MPRRPMRLLLLAALALALLALTAPVHATPDAVVLKLVLKDEPKPTPAKSTPRPDRPEPTTETPKPTPAKSSPQQQQQQQQQDGTPKPTEDCPCRHQNETNTNQSSTNTNTNIQTQTNVTVVQVNHTVLESENDTIGAVHSADQVDVWTTVNTSMNATTTVLTDVAVVLEACTEVVTLTDRCVVKSSGDGAGSSVSVLCIASSKVANETVGSCAKPIVVQMTETTVVTGVKIEYVEIVKQTTLEIISILDLHDNWISNVSIASAAASSSKLISLDLSHNNITTIENIRVPGGIQKLNLAYTLLKEVVLTEIFSAIRWLDLSYTHITVLETTVATELMDLRVEYTSLTSWEHIKISETVRILDVAGNALTNWTYAVLPKKLQSLNASSCNITTLVQIDMSSLTELSLIDFSSNVIEKISSVVWPPKLDQLNLGETTIQSIDIRESDLQIFKNLTTFHFGTVTKTDCANGAKPQEVANGATICVFNDDIYTKFIEEFHRSDTKHTDQSNTSGNQSTTKPDQTGAQSTPKPDQTDAQSTPKPDQTGAQPTPKPDQTGAQSTTKPDQTSAQSTPKPDQTGAQSTPKPDQAGAQSTTKPDQTNVQSTTKPDQTGAQSTTKPDQTGAQSTPKADQTNAQSTPKPDQPGAESTPNPDQSTPDQSQGDHTKPNVLGDVQHHVLISNDTSSHTVSNTTTITTKNTTVVTNSSSGTTSVVTNHSSSSQTSVIKSSSVTVTTCSEVMTLTDQCSYTSSSNGSGANTSVLCIASSKISSEKEGSCKRPIVLQVSETVIATGLLIERVEIVKIETLEQISTLDLHDNLITNVSFVEGSSTSKLLSIDLSQNKISSIENVHIPVGIQKLNMSYTLLSELVLTQLFSNIRLLDVSYTKVTKVETVVASELLELRVEHSSVTSWESIKFSSKVQILDVSGNSLTEWSKVVLPTDLQLLNASSCNITSLTKVDMSSLTKLTQIDFSDNSIETISGVIWPPKLESLDFGQTKIKTFDIRKSDIQIFVNIKNIIWGGVTKSDCANGATSQQLTENQFVCVYDDSAYSKISTGAATNLRTDHQSDGKFPIWVVILSGIVVLVMLVLLFIIFQRRRHGAEESSESTSTIEEVKATTVVASVAHRETRAESESLVSDLRHDLLLSKWRIDHTKISKLRVVNEGSFAAVYVVRVGKREVVMKQVRFEVSKNHRAIERFAQEIRLSSVVQHPKIVRFIGYSSPTAIEKLSVYTEYMEKGNLAVFLRQQATQMGSRANFTWFSSQQDLPTKLQIAIDISEALMYLHSRNPVVIHRDLRAKNVLLDVSWTAKVTDFGVDRELKEYMEMDTVQWLAPEILRGDAWTVAADIYAFGILLTELDTYEVPFASLSQTRSSSQLALDIVEQKLTPAFHSDCPAPIHELAMACLQFQASARPNASKLYADLLQLRTVVASDDIEVQREEVEYIKEQSTHLAGQVGVAVVVKAAEHLADQGEQHTVAQTEQQEKVTTTTTTTTTRVIREVEEVEEIKEEEEVKDDKSSSSSSDDEGPSGVSL